VRAALLKEINSFRPDVIYAHHTWVSGYVAYRLNKLTGIPYVVTDHDFDEIGDCERFPHRKEFFQTVQSSASRMVDVSKRMQEIRRRIFPEINSRVVYNGADPIPENTFHAPRPVDIVGRAVISCVSMWYQRKGIPKLVEAFSAIGGEFPAAVLRLVGDGPDRPAVMATVAASPVRDRIHILGSQPHERAMQEMCWSDVYALIGRDEPFATTFTEAMMAGLPLIWPDDCGHNDVLVDGVNGVRVPPLDVQATAAALRQLLADGERRKEMGAANRDEAMATLTWDANAQAMIRIFSGGFRNSAG
jgi:glycosyltransferase involved in cell wall biosynthesis